MNNPISFIDVMGLYQDGGGSGLQSFPVHTFLDGSGGGGGGWSSSSAGYAFFGAGMSMSRYGGGGGYQHYGGPTGADYDAFIAMGGGGEGSSVGAWYGEGGRAGMSFWDYIATDYKGSYVGIDAQDIVRDIKSGFAITIVDFNGNMRLVSHIGDLVAGDFEIFKDGIEYLGNGRASIYDPSGGTTISENKPTPNEKFSFGKWLEGSWLDKADKWGFNKPNMVVRGVISINPITNVATNADKMISGRDKIRNTYLTTTRDRFVKPGFSAALSGFIFAKLPVGDYIFEGFLIQTGWAGADAVSQEVIDSF